MLSPVGCIAPALGFRTRWNVSVSRARTELLVLGRREPWFFAGNDSREGDLRDSRGDMARGEVGPIGVIIGDGIVKWTAGGDFARSSAEGILI